MLRLLNSLVLLQRLPKAGPTPSMQQRLLKTLSGTIQPGWGICMTGHDNPCFCRLSQRPAGGEPAWIVCLLHAYLESNQRLHKASVWPDATLLVNQLVFQQWAQHSEALICLNSSSYYVRIANAIIAPNSILILGKYSRLQVCCSTPCLLQRIVLCFKVQELIETVTAVPSKSAVCINRPKPETILKAALGDVCLSSATAAIAVFGKGI